MQIKQRRIYRVADGWRVLDTFAGVDAYDDDEATFSTRGEAMIAALFDILACEDDAAAA
jgi:hypothetical protein